MGVLSPEPADPVSLPCSGLLGFPGVPAMDPGNVQPGSFQIVDFDADGIPDIVFSDSQNVKLVRGTGNGTFGVATVLMPTSSGFHVADVNVDGRPDLVFASFQQITVVLNNGSSGFATPQSSATTFSFEASELSDLNGDGRPDIAGLAVSGEVAVFLNTGSAFGAAHVYPNGHQGSFDFAIGDLTGDSRPDLVVASAAGTVSVLANLGDGTFADRVVYSDTAPPWGIALGDMNGDGRLDVVVGTSDILGDSNVTVMLNLGAGILGSGSTFSTGGIAGGEPRVLAVADVNGDGKMDVGAAQLLNDGASLLLGNGAGQLGTPIVLDIDHYAGAIAFSDLDGDTRTDLVLLNGSSITPYLNNGTSSVYDQRDHYRFNVSMGMRGARMVDLDGNGRPDLIGMGEPLAGGPSSALVVTRLANTTGSFVSTSTTYLSEISTYRSAVTDIDNDNRQDLVVLGVGTSGAAGRTLFNTGNGTLTMAAPFAMVDSGVGFRIGDINGDGWRDFVVMSSFGGAAASHVQYYRGLGNGQFAAGTVIWTGEAVTGVAIADLDMDGKLDLVIDNYTTAAYRRDILRGVGNGSFHPPIHNQVSDMFSNLDSRDFNADGRPDIVGFHGDLNVISVALGNSNGTLASPVYSSAPGVSADPVFADFNGDGHLDVVTYSRSRALILLGRGDGTFQPPTFYDTGRAINEISVGDIDVDGRVDLLFASSLDRVTVLRGRCLN